MERRWGRVRNGKLRGPERESGKDVGGGGLEVRVGKDQRRRRCEESEREG